MKIENEIMPTQDILRNKIYRSFYNHLFGKLNQQK